MADQKIADLTTVTPVDNADWTVVVDVSDTTDGPNGTTKKAARSEFKGDTGATGNAATVTAGTTTTGEQGTDASVTNSGTSSAAVLDFVIPRGETGRNPLTVSASEPASPQQGDLWYQP